MSKRLYLVDTSIWILGLRRDGPAEIQHWLKDALQREMVVIAPVVMLELLTGARTEEQYRYLRDELGALPQVEAGAEAWEKASWMAFSLRRRGVTVPTMDVIIAALAISNNCVLVHLDRHYEMVADVFSELQQVPGSNLKSSKAPLSR